MQEGEQDACQYCIRRTITALSWPGFFAKEAAKCGTSIVAEAGYKPGTTDFGQIIRQAFGVKVKERKEGDGRSGSISLR